MHTFRTGSGPGAILAAVAERPDCFDRAVMVCGRADPDGGEILIYDQGDGVGYGSARGPMASECSALVQGRIPAQSACICDEAGFAKVCAVRAVLEEFRTVDLSEVFFQRDANDVWLYRLHVPSHAFDELVRVFPRADLNLPSLGMLVAPRFRAA